MIVVFLVASDVAYHLEEGGELDGLAVGNALGLKNDEAGERALIGVHLEVLSLPDEAVAMLLNGSTLWIGQSEHHLVEAQVNLPLSDELLAGRRLLLRRMHIDELAVEAALAKPHLAVGFALQIGLDDVALDAVVRQLAVDLNDILAFFLNGLGQTEHAADLLQHAAHLGVEVVVVVDDAQVGMALPCVNHLFVQRACNAESFLVHLLVALCVICRRIVLFCAVGC